MSALTDKEMLFITYGALKATVSDRQHDKETSEILKMVEHHLFPTSTVFIDKDFSFDGKISPGSFKPAPR